MDFSNSKKHWEKHWECWRGPLDSIRYAITQLMQWKKISDIEETKKCRSLVEQIWTVFDPVDKLSVSWTGKPNRYTWKTRTMSLTGLNSHGSCNICRSMLFCSLTNQLIDKSLDRIKQHMQGRRFLNAKGRIFAMFGFYFIDRSSIAAGWLHAK